MLNRTTLSIPFTVLIAAVLITAGCGPTQQGPERLPTYRVQGLVTVDDLPAPGVMVHFHNVEAPEGVVEIYAAKPKAVTDGDGTFAMSTYTNGDGVAAGEYRVTFQWKKFDRLKNGYTGPDQLGGKYADPETSEFTVTVTGDEKQGIQLDPFELKR